MMNAGTTEKNLTHMNIYRIKTKLEEPKSIGEKRLIIEELRDRRLRPWELYKIILGFAIDAVSNDGMLSLVTLVTLSSVRKVVIAISIVTLTLYISLYVLYMLKTR